MLAHAPVHRSQKDPHLVVRYVPPDDLWDAFVDLLQGLVGPVVGDPQCGLDGVMESSLYVLLLRSVEGLPLGQQGSDTLQACEPGRPAGLRAVPRHWHHHC